MSLRNKFLLLLILFFIMIILNLILGSVWIPLKNLGYILTDSSLETVYASIVWDYRIPKLITVILTGIALSVSGLLMQTLFRNPIVGPYVLGLSSGAGLLVALFIFGAGLFGWSPGDVSLTVGAALGSILTLLLVLIIYYRLKDTSALLISGLMMGIFTGAIISVMSYFAEAENLQKYIFWSMGNLGNLSYAQIFLYLLIVSISIFMLLFYVKALNALLLGEQYAESLGFSLKKIHLGILIITGLLTGVVTAMVGPVAFIGLIVPHIARIFFKSNLHQILIPAVILTGGILMLGFDTLAQVPGSNINLPINSITALFGAPLVIYLIFKSRKN